MKVTLRCRDCNHKFNHDCPDEKELPVCPECGGLVRFAGHIGDKAELEKAFEDSLLLDETENGAVQMQKPGL